MKTRSLITFTLALLFTFSLIAEPPRVRTLVVRDGKVVSERVDPSVISDRGDIVEFHTLLGGKRAHLGVSLVDLTSDLREHYGATKDSGVLVGDIETGSPAEKAGLRVGDLILSIDGKDVASSHDLRRGLREKKEGDTVRIEALRGRARQTFVATVVEREPQILAPGDLGELRTRIAGPEWRARLDAIGPNCNELQSRIKELETRLKDLERKLQK